MFDRVADTLPRASGARRGSRVCGYRCSDQLGPIHNRRTNSYRERGDAESVQQHGHGSAEKMTETRATKPPELKFGPTTTIHGFLSSDIASFSDLRPTRIVRELLQNSLDAAVEAGESQAIVRFKASMMEVTELPDVDGYESAFREAVEDQTRMSGSGELSDAAQQVVNTIEQALRDLRRSGVCCLSVLDNGVGLDDKRMNALLGDGAGSKDPELAGSYGVGHLSAIPASDFRYLLYRCWNQLRQEAPVLTCTVMACGLPTTCWA